MWTFCQLQVARSLSLTLCITWLALIGTSRIRIGINCDSLSDATSSTALAPFMPQRCPTNGGASVGCGSVGPMQDKISPLNQANQQVQAKLVAAKSNNRLVNKLKDARHRRRRQRLNRHRHLKLASPVAKEQSSLKLTDRSVLPKPAQLVSDQQQQQQQQPTSSASSSQLTALESIIEEVTRAGQQGSSSSSTLSSSSSASSPPPTLPVAGSDLLIDGSESPPIIHMAPNVAQGQQQTQPLALAPNQAPQAQSQQSQYHSQAQATSLTSLRGHHASTSRGFFLTTILSKIMNVLNVTEFASEMREGISSRASCMACNAVVGLYLSPLYSKEVFGAAIRTVCTSFKIQGPRVCTGLVESFQDDFDYIRKNTKLTRDEVCGVVFGIDCARRATYSLFWTVPIPGYIPTKYNLPPPPAAAASSSSNGQASKQPATTQQVSSRPSQDSFANLDDAPDLFEYRKSTGSGKQQQLPPAPAALKADATNQQVNAAGHTVSHPETKQVQTGGNLNQQTASASESLQSKSLQRPGQFQNFEDNQQQQQVDSNRSDGLLSAAGEPSDSRNPVSSFVQITDIHIDPYYETGTLSDCKEPLCCRATSGLVAPGDKRRQAGKWGDYGNCDLPVRTLRSALERIREHHSNAEYWLWTGDISPHDIWNISKAEAANHVRLVSKMIRDYSNGLPVFPVIGNHEAHPVNSFSPPEIKGKYSMSWLYDLLADEWSQWLTKEALETLRMGGYYKFQVRKGFRILALNTNYCARLNPWSFYDPVDPASQLKWLVEELLEAEKAQDKVHIIGHVPPDSRECTQAWLFNFINICDRFRDTIQAQFYGHTHRDEFRIMYSLNRPEEPIGVQYIGPSLTPFTENNPAYRIYHQDSRGHLIGSDTYYFNLTEANEMPNNEPNWQYSYSPQTHLNMTEGLTPSSWHQYVNQLGGDEYLFDSFFKRYFRASDAKSGQVCRYKCKEQILGDLRLLHPYKTKPKPFLANRKTSNHNHHNHNHHHHLHHYHKRLRHANN